MESDERGTRIMRKSELEGGKLYDIYSTTGSGIPLPGGPYRYKGFRDVNENYGAVQGQSVYMFLRTTDASANLRAGGMFTPYFHQVEGANFPDGTPRPDVHSGEGYVETDFNNTNEVNFTIYKRPTDECAGGGCSIMGGRRKYKRKTNKRKTNKRKMNKRKTKMRY